MGWLGEGSAGGMSFLLLLGWVERPVWRLAAPGGCPWVEANASRRGLGPLAAPSFEKSQCDRGKYFPRASAA